jgi:hypothetical protein
MMAAWSMDVSMLQLFLGRGARFHDFDVEVQRFARQWMVEMYTSIYPHSIRLTG